MSHDTFSVSTLQILRDLSSQLGVNYDSGEIKVVRGEREFLMFIYLPLAQYSKVGAPSYFEIKTKIPFSHPSFGVRKSDSFDWIKEHVLSTPDFQIGDADFDANFHIRVNDKDWGSRFFSSSDIRLSISELLQQGFDLLRSEDGYLKVLRYLQLGGPYPTVEMINNAIDRLDIINDNIPDNYVCKHNIPDNLCKPAYVRSDKDFKKRMALVIVFFLFLGAIMSWPVIMFILHVYNTYTP